MISGAENRPTPEGLGDSFQEMAERLRLRPPLTRISLACLIGFVCASPFSISLAQLFVFTGIGAWLISLWKEPRGAELQFPLWKSFVMFAGLTLLSAFLSDDPVRSLKDSRQLLQILIFYLAIHTVQDEWEAMWLVKALLAASALAALYTLGVAQLRPLGLANRMSGFFSVYMTLAGFLVIAGSVALTYILIPIQGEKKGWVYGAGLLILGALMSTLSRNAWMGIGTAAVFILVAGRNWKGAAWLAAVAVVVILVSPGAIQDRIRSMLNPQDVTANERVLMWESGMRMVRERPLLGFGLDMIKRDYSRFADPKAIKQRTGHLHNNLLHIAAERGVPALAAWIWIWAGFFILGGRRLTALRGEIVRGRFLKMAGLAAIAGFLVAGLFEYNFGDSEVVMAAYFTMALPFMGESTRTQVTST